MTVKENVSDVMGWDVFADKPCGEREINRVTSLRLAHWAFSL